MERLNIVARIRKHIDTKKQQKVASRLFRARVRKYFHSSNRQIKALERKEFVEALQMYSISAEVYVRLAQDAGANLRVFLDWEKKDIANRNAKTLADIVPKTAFSKLLCVVRERYAFETGDLIPTEEAMKIVVEEILLHA